MTIETTEEYFSARALFHILSRLGSTKAKNIWYDIETEYGPYYEECYSCGHVQCDCRCNAEAFNDNWYDDEASFGEE